MERELWEVLYGILTEFGPCVGVRGESFSDGAIAATYLWAVVHDRPTAWACRADNWAGRPAPPPFDLPSQPTMSRRLAAGAPAAAAAGDDAAARGVWALLDRVWARLMGMAALGACAVKLLDGKPLPVGRHTKDPDARRGWGAGGYDRGYKLHALYGTDGPLPLAWDVRPMNEAEPAVARGLVGRGLRGRGGVVLADSADDSNPLHAAVAARGHALLAPRKRPGAGLRNGRHDPHRLLALHRLEGPGRAEWRAVYAGRVAIERRFGNLTAFGGGLAPLPAWVRRLRRVRLWVLAKLLVNAVRIRRKEAAVAAA